MSIMQIQMFLLFYIHFNQITEFDMARDDGITNAQRFNFQRLFQYLAVMSIAEDVGV